MMAAAAKKQTVPQWKVDMMVKHYGSIEAARSAYRAVRAEVLAQTKDDVLMGGGKVLFVEMTGRITVTRAASVFYAGSVDARFVLPVVRPRSK